MPSDVNLVRRGHVLQIWHSRFASLDIVRESHRVLFVYAVRWPFEMRFVVEVPWKVVPEIIDHLNVGPGSQSTSPSAPEGGDDPPS